MSAGPAAAVGAEVARLCRAQRANKENGWHLDDAVTALARAQAFPGWDRLPQPLRAEIDAAAGILARVGAVGGAEELPPYGYAVEQPDGHITFFREDPTGMRAEKWSSIGVKVIDLAAITTRPAAAAHPANTAEAPSLWAGRHPDDAAVRRFAAAMMRKMSASREKGRHGWDDEAICPTERLQAMLLDHLAKGDPLDVANFCMMLWSRGAPVVAAAAPNTASQVDPCMALPSTPTGD